MIEEKKREEISKRNSASEASVAYNGLFSPKNRSRSPRANSHVQFSEDNRIIAIS